MSIIKFIRSRLSNGTNWESPLESERNTTSLRWISGEVSLTDDSDAKSQEPLLGASPAQHALTRQLAMPGAGHRCPHCGSIIYSRRHKLCGVCSQELPAELLFPKQEAERLQCLLQYEQLRHRIWMAKAFHQALAPSFLPTPLR
jgi:hypothetical protein